MVKGQVFNTLEPGKIYSFNMSSFQSNAQNVTRLPRCPVCGVSPVNQVLQAVRNLG
jgi:hypothetical protein